MRLCSHLVPEHWCLSPEKKIVLCSDTGNSKAPSTMQCPSTRSRPCTRTRAPWPNSGVGTWSLGVFTLVPIKNCSQAPCSGTKSKRNLRLFEGTKLVGKRERGKERGGGGVVICR